jgi:hypothetical protein
MSLKEEFCRLLNSSETGSVSDALVKEQFGERYQSLAPIINEMLTSKRLVLLTQGDRIYYKQIREEIALKFEGLG